MLWLLATVASYFFSGLATLIDKYLLAGPIPHPRVYTFYIGLLGVSALAFSPFGFFLKDPFQIIFALLSGALLIFALFWFFKSLSLFEASRVVPAIGALTPLFVFGLTNITGFKSISSFEVLAFFLLILGSVFISLGEGSSITLKSFSYSLVAAFLFSLSFYLAKIVYEAEPFWPAFIWMRIGGVIFVLFLLISPKSREEIFFKKITVQKRSFRFFFLGQVFGASSAFLQNWAIALVPVSFLAFVNALEGIKYLFILIFVILLSLKFPDIFKEESSKKAVLEKVLAILLISAGLTLLALRI